MEKPAAQFLAAAASPPRFASPRRRRRLRKQAINTARNAQTKAEHSRTPFFGFRASLMLALSKQQFKRMMRFAVVNKRPIGFDERGAAANLVAIRDEFVNEARSRFASRQT